MVGGNEMKAGKKVLENRIEEFCKTSSQLLQSIHVRCGETDGSVENGQQKRGRKKKSRKK